MEFTFTTQMIEWRGPAPFYFAPIPHEIGQEIKASASMLTYGWGVIPVKGLIGNTEFTTSLIPKDGVYLVPIKNAVRLPEKINLGDEVTLEIRLG